MRTSAPINQIIDEWLSNADVMFTTKVSYRSKVGLWHRYLAKTGRDPRTPTRADLLNYKSWLELGGKAILTIDGYVTAVRIFYKFCSARGYCENIGAGIRSTSRYRGHRKGILTAIEAARLLDSITTNSKIGKRDKLLIAIMLMMGLRTCEIEHINIGDFDVVGGVVTVHIQRKGRREKAEMMAVPPTVLDLMTDYIADRCDVKETSPLFINHDRRPTHCLLRKSISEIVRHRLVAIGIVRPDITAHSLRHTCACLMLSSGVDLEKVRDMLGHTTTNTTRIYTSEMQAQVLIKNSPSLLVEAAIINASR